VHRTLHAEVEIATELQPELGGRFKYRSGDSGT
jgi:hypothetical protein